jgi:hypothetical protein
MGPTPHTLFIFGKIKYYQTVTPQSLRDCYGMGQGPKPWFLFEKIKKG